MFTGIIEGLGSISRTRTSGQGKRLTIEAEFALDQTKVGDSISVSGACLTAVRIDGRRFEIDVSPETLKMTTLGSARVGDRINLERAMRLSDRIDGHLVSGHIDGTGVIRGKTAMGNAVAITFEADESLTRYMINKGSVAVDGISLTINTCSAGSFSVAVIPHTVELTTIGFKNIGDRINIETDMIGKYVERFSRSSTDQNRDGTSRRTIIDQAYLVKTGFID